MTTSPITRFTGQYAFLSNFYPQTFFYEAKLYPTSEHAYQAAKMLYPNDAESIRNAVSPGWAKRQARLRPMKYDWDRIKLQVMSQILLAKFTTPTLRSCLLATSDRQLVEGNTWNDTYWGVCNGVGENHLGKILMQVREELRRG